MFSKLKVTWHAVKDDFVRDSGWVVWFVTVCVIVVGALMTV